MSSYTNCVKLISSRWSFIPSPLLNVVSYSAVQYYILLCFLVLICSLLCSKGSHCGGAREEEGDEPVGAFTNFFKTSWTTFIINSIKLLSKPNFLPVLTVANPTISYSFLLNEGHASVC